ncbi:MAG: four helix bundle protein [Sedimentisphaerales bacterium]|nr:four helix bundle protein [Sedimentisphaerales bacterium]
MDLSKTKGYKGMVVWQKAYKLVLEIYKLTSSFPKSEIYGLAQQMRRAAVSVPSNIAEGYCRKHKAEYRQFMSIAYGSLSELETQYMLSIDLKYTDSNSDIENLFREAGAILYRIINPKE